MTTFSLLLVIAVNLLFNLLCSNYIRRENAPFTDMRLHHVSLSHLICFCDSPGQRTRRLWDCFERHPEVSVECSYDGFSSFSLRPPAVFIWSIQLHLFGVHFFWLIVYSHNAGLLRRALVYKLRPGEISGRRRLGFWCRQICHLSLCLIWAEIQVSLYIAAHVLT